MYSLVLGGGGFRGSAHVGVYSRCEAQNRHFELIVGTSIGALVGGLIATGCQSADLIRLFKPLRPRHLLSYEPNRLGFVGMHKLERRLRSIFGYQRIEDLPIRYAAVTLDLATQQIVVCEHGDVVDAILASCAIPGVFAPRLIDGRWMADGGLINNVPVDVAQQLGASYVVAVDVIGLASPVVVPQRGVRFKTPLTLIEQSILLMMRTITTKNLQLNPPDVLIQPDIDAASVGGFLSFAAGFQAGVEAFNRSPLA